MNNKLIRYAAVALLGLVGITASANASASPTRAAGFQTKRKRPMYSRYTPLVAALTVFSVGAEAQELTNRTVAEATARGDRQVSIDLNSRFELVTEGRPALQETDIVATWQRVGGIDPTPFRIVIPAGCFVAERDRLRVRGTSCGVQVYLESELLEVETFAALAFPPEPVAPGDPLQFRVRMTVVADSARSSSVLSTLGGAEVSLTIGRESAVALPKSIDAFAGIEPEPF